MMWWFMLGLLVLLQLPDVWLTREIVIKRDQTEANPVYAKVIARGGEAGFYAFKAGVTVALVALVWYSGPTPATYHWTGFVNGAFLMAMVQMALTYRSLRRKEKRKRNAAPQ